MKIKELNSMIGKKAQSTLMIVIMLVAVFFASILLLVAGVTSTTMNNALDQDIDMGQVNLKEVNSNTFGKFNEMIVVNADWWGISLIFGMILGLFLSAYVVRSRFPKWGLILDIFIIVFVFLVSLYISATYQTLLDSLASANVTFLEDYTVKTSMFILNLPVFVVVIGVVMMILFHSSIPRRTEERIQEGGVLRGI
jgi:hypothetical protein